MNLNKCKFLSRAVTYIKNHPGCCKRDIVYGVGRLVYTANPNSSSVPNRTKAYRYSALDKLEDCDDITMEYRGGKYSFYYNNELN